MGHRSYITYPGHDRTGKTPLDHLWRQYRSGEEIKGYGEVPTGMQSHQQFSDFIYRYEMQEIEDAKTPEMKAFERLDHYCKIRRADLIGTRYDYQSPVEGLSGVGSIGRKLAQEYFGKLKSVNGKSKYYPIEERKDRMKKCKTTIANAISKFLEKEGYKLNFAASEIGTVVMDEVRGSFKVETWEADMAFNANVAEDIRERWRKATNAVDKVYTDIVCGVEKDAVSAFKKIEKTDW